MNNCTSKQKLFDWLSQGAVVITPNNRLSSHILRDYFTYSAHPTVDKPLCQPYGMLLAKTFKHLEYNNPNQEFPALLNTTQSQHLWRTVLKADSSITYSEGLLHAVIEAWHYCQQWAIEDNHDAFTHTPQARKFQQWWQEINHKLAHINAITEHQIVPNIINHPLFIHSPTVIWACFDGFNPQQLELQQHLEAQGLEQYQYDLEPRADAPALYAAPDDKDEYEQLIAWLHSRIALQEQRIGVVIPNLQGEARQIQRLMLQHFEPELFNISLGAPLTEFPLVAHALSWLKLDRSNYSNHQVALLLQSPYLMGAQSEFLRRSHYLQDNSLLQKHSISFNTLVEQLSSATPKLAAALNKITPYPKSASLTTWVGLFQQRLNQLGFPGDYGLNSENHQCYNRFIALFDEFRQLSLVTPILEQNEALNALSQLCAHAIFQAQKTTAIIHISGILEASGCEFDSLWVNGLTDQCLPQKTRLSAFIPVHLQCELQTPHSTPERELELARGTLQRLGNSAARVVFSYPQLKGDTPNLPCALFTALPQHAPLLSQQDSAPVSVIESFAEPYQLPLRDTEQIAGGTTLLANQAKCPFKAFAQHRLTAKPIVPTSEGLNALDKGKMLHKIMEILWQELKTQQHLKSMADSDLDAMIDEAILSTLALSQQSDLTHGQLLHEIESSRLKRLVLSCLEWEKQRPDFAIAALEASYTINLAGLNIDMRVDRLDISHDKKWVIDYKSSLPASKPWNEERPKEPQLLLYALLDEEIDTILLLQVKTGKILCSGLSADKLDIRGISTLKKDESWTGARTYWQQQLTGLAEEIKQGYCVPQPASSSLCQQCDFHSLCRFNQ